MTTRTDGDLHAILEERGLVAQCTDRDIRERLATPLTAYIGFDPTADSLHVGSLVPVMALAWLQRCGHRPLAVIGGATALIGDPSGKSEQRRMLDREQIRRNAAGVAEQIGRIVRFGAGPSDARMLDNADWLAERNWIDLLREVGAQLSVNRMIGMESVKGRMEAGGITFLEFNYMVMQAYDFLHLYRSEGCTLQMGGQDQWGNIVMGIDLGRRLADASLAGLTMPLITKSDGSKFGKSEQGNVWLSAELTPVYEFYQFWRNVGDADVARFLAYFTFLPMDRVHELVACSGQAINEAKEVLALEVTSLVHGRAAAEQAHDDARKAFSAGHDVSGASIPHAILAASELEGGIGILSLLVRGGLAGSNSEARRLVQQGGVRVHDTRIDDPTARIGSDRIVDGHLLLRAGKKRLFRFDVA